MDQPTLTERDTFLQAIIEDPWNDGPRLMFADWLDEHGEEDRAEFIRLQCASADSPSLDSAAREQRFHAYDTQAGNLLWKRINRPAKDIDAVIWAGMARDLVPNGALYIDHLYWRRGFLENVTCSPEDWRKYGATILAEHPLTLVRLRTTVNRLRQERAAQDIHRGRHDTLLHFFQEINTGCARLLEQQGRVELFVSRQPLGQLSEGAPVDYQLVGAIDPPSYPDGWENTPQRLTVWSPHWVDLRLMVSEGSIAHIYLWRIEWGDGSTLDYAAWLRRLEFDVTDERMTYHLELVPVNEPAPRLTGYYATNLSTV